MTSEQVPNASPSPEEIQSYLPAYDSIQLLAVGGMGAVYKARQISLDRPVAIKVLTHACSSSLQFRQIFKCEAQVMAKLNHANLASIYDYGEANGLLYIVMQLVEGRTLHQAAHGQSVAPQESAALISKISKALATAHSSGILHRDIKPANILIDSEINPVVVDFGLAHHSDESTMKGETVFGTPGYTAPEVLAPPYHADQRADIFSLGVLLHELLTGEMPQKPYLPPSSLVGTDPRYDNVVMRAIHPNPALRYPTAGELAEDLDKIVANQGLSASPLLLTPASHPELSKRTASQPVTTQSSPTKIPQLQTSQPSQEKVVTLPTLNKSQGNNPSAVKMALAACIALAMIITVCVIGSVEREESSTNSDKGVKAETSSPGHQDTDEKATQRTEPTSASGITASSL